MKNSFFACLKIMNALCVQEALRLNTWIIPAQILYTDALTYSPYICNISIRFDLLFCIYDFFTEFIP